MRKCVYLLGAAAMVLAAPKVRGQSVTPGVMNNSGGYGVISGKTFEWSVGELFISTATMPSVVVTQGLLQPIDKNVGVNGDPKIASQLAVYPNPSSTEVNISFNAPTDGTLTYRLMDVTGRLITENTTDVHPGASLNRIDMKRLAVASYMLQVTFAANGLPGSSTTYKIQKLD